MKFQSIIIVLTRLVTSMSVFESQEMFGDYPYCKGCESNYKDIDGDWYYAGNSWCKINEKKCNPATTSTCEPVDDFPCCENSSIRVSYVDFNGEWGIENNKWCLINSFPEFTDVDITLYSWLDLMPMSIPSEDYIRPAYFVFTTEVETSVFLEKYEVEKVMINEKEINITEVEYSSNQNGFRIDTIYYKKDSNDVRIIIRNKETNKRYLKEIIAPLDIAE